MANHQQQFTLSPIARDAIFDGDTYDQARDQQRLSGQLSAVYQAMQDGKWHTLNVISRRSAVITGKHVSEASASARLRDLRKDRFGAHTVERKSAGGGLFLYRLKTHCTTAEPCQETT